MSKILLWLLLFIVPVYAQDDYIRQTLPRDEINELEIIYYLSRPDQEKYPIVVLCEGSYCAGQPIKSPSGLLKNFLPILKNCNVGLLAVEKWGVNGANVDEKEFHAHNTITQWIEDHERVIDHLTTSNPNGWDGRLVFLGGSEGGDVATALTVNYRKQVLATIIFAGIGLKSRQDEIWDHMQIYLENASWYEKLGLWFMGISKNREKFDEQVKLMEQNPNPKKWWYGQTYKYWADAFTRSRESLSPEFYNLKSPIFISTGTADSFIESSDELVEKMKQHDMNVTYHRLQDVPHGMTDHAPQIFDIAATWLQKILENDQK
jgi:pimeloyl-ACP methyl ester carboxylesterase